MLNKSPPNFDDFNYCLASPLLAIVWRRRGWRILDVAMWMQLRATPHLPNLIVNTYMV